MLAQSFGDNRHFYPRSPCGERRQTQALKIPTHSISIHALLAESDPTTIITICIAPRFLSTLSLRRATFSVFASPFSIFYFYPRSPCGERPASGFLIASRSQFLSTLSLRRATGCQRPCERPTTDFYPRSPCGERPGRAETVITLMGFLSTLSLRRAT